MEFNHLAWTAPLPLPIEAELLGRKVGCPHREVSLIGADALEWIDPGDYVSDADCLVHVFEPDVTPESCSWPVTHLPVAVALGPLSIGLERRFIETLRLYRPSQIVTYLHSAGAWHGPYEHDVQLAQEAAA